MCLKVTVHITIYLDLPESQKSYLCTTLSCLSIIYKKIHFNKKTYSISNAKMNQKPCQQLNCAFIVERRLCAFKQ